MFFVLLSHFGFTFFPNQADPVPTAMRFAGMVASPTFMILSGLILGFLYRTSPGS
jgi:peptidoglycan/LPS O-acetylase OafA/YrhL